MAEKTLYTALGHFRCRNDGGGRRYPVILMDHREFGMDPQEMTIWTALCWRLTDRQRAEDFYEQLSNGMQLFPRRSFSDCLDRLVTRGLVAKGSGTTDFDALYDLLGELYVVPISSSFPLKVVTFLKLLRSGTAPGSAAALFRRDRRTEPERRVMALSGHTPLSTAELVRCAERDISATVGSQQTLALLFADDAPHYVVKYGMEGSDITEMQEQLKDLGYMSAITGYYGDKTVAALRDFQDRNGLSPDGMCGEKTFELLYSDDAKESASKAKSARTKANIDKMISVAKKQLGDKYVLGAKGPDKFDCSGLVYYCLKEAGSNRRRLNAAGYSGVDDWTKITKMSDLKRGDLIFFYDNNFTKIGHVGIVLNSSEMIDASNNKGKVVRRDYTESYWRKHFYCGRRPW